MRNPDKIMCMLVLCCILLMSQMLHVKAVESPNKKNNTSEVVYDIEAGGIQTFSITKEDGNVSEVTIEEIPSRKKTTNGTYKIKQTTKGAWEAGFFVKIDSNRFTKAYNEFCKPLNGSISQTSLRKVSDAQISLNFRYTLKGYSKRGGVTAKIKNKQLMVSVI